MTTDPNETAGQKENQWGIEAILGPLEKGDGDGKPCLMRTAILWGKRLNPSDFRS